MIEESIDILEPTGWNQGLAAALTEVGRALVAEGRVAEAVGHHRRALRTATDVGQPNAIAEAFEGMAEAAVELGDETHAVEFLGSAAAVRTRMGVSKLSARRARALDELTVRLRASLGEPDFSRAFASGECLAPTEVVAFVETAPRFMSEV